MFCTFFEMHKRCRQPSKRIEEPLDFSCCASWLRNREKCGLKYLFSKGFCPTFPMASAMGQRESVSIFPGTPFAAPLHRFREVVQGRVSSESADHDHAGFENAIQKRSLRVSTVNVHPLLKPRFQEHDTPFHEFCGQFPLRSERPGCPSDILKDFQILSTDSHQRAERQSVATPPRMSHQPTDGDPDMII